VQQMEASCSPTSRAIKAAPRSSRKGNGRPTDWITGRAAAATAPSIQRLGADRPEAARAGAILTKSLPMSATTTARRQEDVVCVRSNHRPAAGDDDQRGHLKTRTLMYALLAGGQPCICIAPCIQGIASTHIAGRRTGRTPAVSCAVDEFLVFTYAFGRGQKREDQQRSFLWWRHQL